MQSETAINKKTAKNTTSSSEQAKHKAKIVKAYTVKKLVDSG